jgi:VanZ family protein
MDTRIDNPNWTSISILGAIAALLAVLAGIVETAISFLPGASQTPTAVTEWFTLFQQNRFLGLRDLGLINLLLTIFGILVLFSIYEITKRENNPYTTLALLIAAIGGAVYIAANRALPMMVLSDQYAVASTEEQQIQLLAVGQALLAIGRSHTAGTFLGHLLNIIPFVIVSFVMLKSKIFDRVTAIIGILGFGLIIVYEVYQLSFPAMDNVVVIISMVGGLLSMIWFILVARRLFYLGKNVSAQS